MIVKEKLQEYLNGMKLTIGRDFRVNKADTESKIRDLNYIKKVVGRQGDIEKR